MHPNAYMMSSMDILGPHMDTNMVGYAISNETNNIEQAMIKPAMSPPLIHDTVEINNTNIPTSTPLTLRQKILNIIKKVIAWFKKMFTNKAPVQQPAPIVGPTISKTGVTMAHNVRSVTKAQNALYTFKEVNDPDFPIPQDQNIYGKVFGFT